MYLIQGLNRAATVNAGGLATSCAGRRRTWAELAARIARLAGGLAQLGIGKGDRVALLALNSDKYLEALYAVPCLGAIVVPLNTRLAPPEIAFILEDSGAKALIVDDAFAAMPGQLPSLFATENILHIGESEAPAGMTGWEAMLSNPIDLNDRAGGGDVAGIFYTGGTTGRPKGVMLTHTNLVSNAMQMLHAMDYRHDTTYIHAAPMFHLADGASTFAVTMVGGTHTFLPRFDPVALLSAIASERVTNTLIVPTMIAAVANHPDVLRYDLSSLRIVAYGASPMPEAVIRKAAEVMPAVRFLQAYGMTELSPVVTVMDRHIAPSGRQTASCGRPFMLVDVKVCDENDNEVPRGQVGEVLVRAPNMMKGYWKQPEVTANALRGGWYHTGDGGIMDDDGYLYIVDRLKDMIVTGGENVYSAEVESAISLMPGVAEVAVIGIPDERWGETIHAAVVPRPGAELTPEAVIAHARTLIAPFKCPRSVEIRDTPLPLSGAGKVLKTVLREPFWAGREKRVN
jgi:long-chain acyl-CoA synthetase